MTNHNIKKDSDAYLQKKNYYKQFLTIYGKNAVLDALEDKTIEIAKVHIAESRNKKLLQKIMRLTDKRSIELNITTKEQVSRISKNSKQDQGLVADIKMNKYLQTEDFFSTRPKCYKLLALDGITTPANVGMIIRSAAAGGIDGVVIPEQGCCKINPMVIKSSVGTIFKTTIIRSNKLSDFMRVALEDGANIVAMDLKAKTSLFDYQKTQKEVFVLGAESVGVSEEVKQMATQGIYIPMSSGVESLNVAMAATLIAFN